MRATRTRGTCPPSPPPPPHGRTGRSQTESACPSAAGNPRAAAVMDLPFSARMTARSTAFWSSRTLPGHRYCMIARRADPRNQRRRRRAFGRTCAGNDRPAAGYPQTSPATAARKPGNVQPVIKILRKWPCSTMRSRSRFDVARMRTLTLMVRLPPPSRIRAPGARAGAWPEGGRKSRSPRPAEAFHCWPVQIGPLGVRWRP